MTPQSVNESLEARFLRLVDEQRVNPPSRKEAERCRSWLEGVSLEDVIDSLGKACWRDLRTLARRLTSNPPAVLDLSERHGYVLQLLYWFPIREQQGLGSYDTEDIHGHFGFIATKSLVGDAYRATVYARLAQNQIMRRGDYTFREGSTFVIAPEDVHSVSHLGKSSSVSLRVVLPYTESEMFVYDAKTGSVKEVIRCGSEQKLVELGGLLSSLRAEGLKRYVSEIESALLHRSSKQELSRLISCAP